MTKGISGYNYGEPTLSHSPVSLDDFDLLKQSVLFDEEDVKHLRLSYPIVQEEADAILDVWYGFIGANPHLLASFVDTGSGKPLHDYLGAVRKRFGKWILDTARAEYDQVWLNYQHEIGLRHYRTKKNQTDNAPAPSIVPFRYLAPLVFPVTYTLKPFLAKQGHFADEVEKMHAAWVKSCLLQVTLWSYPYVQNGDF